MPTPVTNIVTKVMSITPKLATEWLTTDPANADGRVNRNVRPVWVKYLAGQMEQLRWKITTDFIGFREDGVLVNGQHRLLAVVAYGKPVDMPVVWGLDEDAYKLIDRGRMRSMHDVLHVEPILIADATMAFMIAYGVIGHRIAEIDVADTIAWWAPAHERLLSGVRLRKGLASAHLRIGYGARWAIQTDDTRRSYVLDQYKAMMLNDTSIMTKATATLWKKLIEQRSAGSQLERVEMAARCFYYANPVRAEVKPVIKDLTPHTKELENVLTYMEAAFMAAPKGASHPYVFPKNVLQTRVASVKPKPGSHASTKSGNGASVRV